MVFSDLEEYGKNSRNPVHDQRNGDRKAKLYHQHKHLHQHSSARNGLQSLEKQDQPCMPLLMRRFVGSFSRAAHFNASSSSASIEDLENTSMPLFLHILELLIRALLTPNMSPPSIIVS